MKKRKRIVSKSQYLAYLVGKKTLDYTSMLLWIGGVLCGILAAVGGVLASSLYSRGMFGLLMIMTIICGCTAGVLIVGAVSVGKEVEKMEPVLPSTRKNMEQLPAEETLVRASSEPTAVQEKVLLRAAQPTQETETSELLRPSS